MKRILVIIVLVVITASGWIAFGINQSHGSFMPETCKVKVRLTDPYLTAPQVNLVCAMAASQSP